MLPLLSLFRKNDFNLKSPQMPKREPLKHLKSFLFLGFASLVVFQIKFEPLADILTFYILKSRPIFKIGKPVSDLK